MEILNATGALTIEQVMWTNVRATKQGNDMSFQGSMILKEIWWSEN